MRPQQKLQPWSPQAGIERESFGELLGELLNQSAGLVRDEVALAKQELSEKLHVFQSVFLVLAVGMLLGIVAALALCAAAIIALVPYLGAWQAALMVGGVLAVVAGVITFIGLKRLKHLSLKPEQTLETLEEDKVWLKQII